MDKRSDPEEMSLGRMVKELIAVEIYLATGSSTSSAKGLDLDKTEIKELEKRKEILYTNLGKLERCYLASPTPNYVYPPIYR